MACFPNLLLLCFVICSFVKDVVGQNNAQVQANDNAEQFALLCRIYNVAKNPPINHVDFQDPNKIMNEIDILNASFAEEKWMNETENVENSSVAQVKPTTTREAAVPQAMLSRITQKAHNILDEIRKNNVSEEIEKVKAELSHVIFGAGGAESDLCNGSLKDVTGRGAACGNSGLHAKGQSAGNNLVVDFFCLCAQRNDDGIHDACKVKVGSKSEKHSWGDKAPSGSSSMWASIKKECENLLHQHPKSAKEGHEVIDDFWNHLKSGGLYRWGNTRKVDGSERKPGMLGTGAGTEGSGGKDVVCDGRRGYTATRGSGTPPGGICVYYGQEPQWEENIEWLKKLKTAMNTVDVLNNKTATIKRDIEKLHMLLHRAEKVYESAKLITEIQQPVLPTNLQTTAKRLTAYSASRRHHPNTHFFSLFVLL